MKKSELYSIVVPVYNSEKSLKELYERIKLVFDNIEAKEFELILVDDSSKDNSFSIMEELHKRDKRVKAIQLAKNCGQHPALLCGFSYASGDYIITMDDDLQHPPEEIPKLIAYMDEHEEVDVVIGKYAEKKHSFIRNMGTAASNWISSIVFGKPMDLQLTSFRLMRKFIVDDLCAVHISTPRIGNMLLQVSNRISNVMVEHDSRKYGKSGYTFFRLVKDLINNIITNSALPLIIVRDIGIVSFCVSIILALFYLLRYVISGVTIQGFTTLVLLILLFSGITLFALGVIGEYLMRILKEAKKMPNFFVRKEVLDD